MIDSVCDAESHKDITVNQRLENKALTSEAFI